MLCRVTGSIGCAGSEEVGCVRSLCEGGGSAPPRTTDDMKPLFCRASMRPKWNFVSGIEVRPKRAREAFWRWEQVLARWTRDIFAMGACPEGLVEVGYEGRFSLPTAAIKVGVRNGRAEDWLRADSRCSWGIDKESCRSVGERG